MGYRMSKTVAGPFLHALWRPKVTGREHVPLSGPAIIASNHLSVIDSVFIPLAVRRPMTFVAKAEYFTGERPIDRLTSWYLRQAGQLSIERGHGRSAMSSLEAGLEILRDGGLFGIYPEGTRSVDGRLYRGRSGVAWLAMTAGVPVIPAAVGGTDRALPRGQAIPRPTRVTVTFGPALHFDEYAGQAGKNKARKEVAAQIMRAIQDLSGQEYVDTYAPVPVED